MAEHTGQQATGIKRAYSSQRCSGHRDNQEPLIPGVSDFVLRTKVGPPPGSHRSTFHRPPERPDFKRTDWANFQTQLEELILFDLEMHNEMPIDTCVEKFSGAVL